MDTDNKTPQLLVQHGYRYRSLIGEGSNGKTYFAQNLKTGEFVAIKAIKFSENLKNYELFKREAEVLQSIHVPGVPRFYEFIASETEFTECWIVQEYIRGESILDILEERKKQHTAFTVKETIEIIYETAKIIRMLQNNYVPPIIHRDIKPSNILISTSSNSDIKIHLIDFGAVANPQKRSNQSTVAGTVGYMPPEQLLGNCSIQSDYYALGATALHMLTGIMPSDFPTIGFQLQFEQVLKEKIPDIPPEFIQFLKTLMSPNIIDRPQNANELIEKLNKLVEDLNRDVFTEYNKLKKKCDKLNDNSNSIFLYYTPKSVFEAIGYGVFISLILSVLISVIFFIIFIDLTHIFEQHAAHNALFMLFTFIITSVVIIRVFIHRYDMVPKLQEKLDEFNFINIKRVQTQYNANQQMQNHSGASIVEGTIATVMGKRIEYYYEADGKALCGYKDLSDNMINSMQKNNIILEPGQKIKVQYIKQLSPKPHYESALFV